MFRFCLIKTHPGIPPTWWLDIPTDGARFEILARAVSWRLCCRFNEDPHAGLLTGKAVILSKAWLEMAARGRKLMGRHFGMIPAAGCDVLEECFQENLADWPGDPDPNETITVFRWPLGSHYYLKSNKGRIFQDKFDTLEAATAEASRWVPEGAVVVAPREKSPADGD